MVAAFLPISLVFWEVSNVKTVHVTFQPPHVCLGYFPACAWRTSSCVPGVLPCVCLAYFLVCAWGTSLCVCAWGTSLCVPGVLPCMCLGYFLACAWGTSSHVPVILPRVCLGYFLACAWGTSSCVHGVLPCVCMVYFLMAQDSICKAGRLVNTSGSSSRMSQTNYQVHTISNLFLRHACENLNICKWINCKVCCKYQVIFIYNLLNYNMWYEAVPGGTRRYCHIIHLYEHVTWSNKYDKSTRIL